MENPAFPSPPPNHGRDCRFVLLGSKGSVQQLMYFCISVFTGFLWIQFDFLIKNNRTSTSSCVFSQNMGDTVIVLWLQGARGVRLTPLDDVGGGDHCKITSSWSSAVFLPFPRQKQSNSLALLLACSSSESPRAVGREQVAVVRFQENTGLLNIPEPLVGKPGTVC